MRDFKVSPGISSIMCPVHYVKGLVREKTKVSSTNERVADYVDIFSFVSLLVLIIWLND